MGNAICNCNQKETTSEFKVKILSDKIKDE